MTLKECYEALNSDYESAVSRLLNESFTKKIVKKFLEDNNMDLLRQSFAAGNMQQAYAAAHTIKGLALNIGFSELSDCSSALSDSLKQGDISNAEEQYAALCRAYEKTVSVLSRLE